MPLPEYLRSGEKIETRELRTPDRVSSEPEQERRGEILSDSVVASETPERDLLTGGQRLERKLGATCEPQLQDFWCWAAVATSLSKFYDAGSTWEQCAVVNRQLGTNQCCGADASTSTCNRVQRLDQALRVTANYSSHQPVDGMGDEPPMTFDDVRAQIDSGRVVCSRVGWGDGTGHFQMIIGWKVVGEDKYIIISDPIYSETEILFSDFASRYQSGGKWNVAYVTVPNSTAADLVSGGGPALGASFSSIVSDGALEVDARNSIEANRAIYRRVSMLVVAPDSIELYGG